MYASFSSAMNMAMPSKVSSMAAPYSSFIWCFFCNRFNRKGHFLSIAIFSLDARRVLYSNMMALREIAFCSFS